MHGLHARLPKNFVLEERLERYASHIEAAPHTWQGRWKQAAHPLTPAGEGAFELLLVDLGCGKGQFTCELAARHPEALVIGIDYEPLCIAYAAQRAAEAYLPNVLFVPGTATRLSSYFAPGELDGLYINFPTPFPRKKQALERLTHANQLFSYREVLAPQAHICFKTDSQPLFDFSLTQVEVAGYKLLWSTRDLHAPENAQASHIPADMRNIVSGYEERLSAQGATVHAFELALGPEPASLEQKVSLSLQDYLPKDLTQLSYVPHGMQGTVLNLKNQRLRQAGKLPPRRKR